MNPKLVGAVTAVALTTASAHAQQNSPQVDMGKYYFESHCAICHGLNGTSLPAEPGMTFLTKNIPNLTTLSMEETKFRRMARREICRSGAESSPSKAWNSILITIPKPSPEPKSLH